MNGDILTTSTPLMNYFWTNYSNVIIAVFAFFTTLAFIKIIIDLTGLIWAWYNKT